MVADGKWKWTFGTLTLVGLVMSLLGGIGQIVLTPGNKTLKISLKKSEDERGKLNQHNEVNQKGFQSAIRDELLTLSDILNWGDSECISLYYDVGGKLLRLGCYSGNSQLEAKTSSSCNYGENFLGKAWLQGGRAFRNSALSTDSTQSLDMEIKTCCVRNIKDFNRRNVAVLLFESVNSNAFTEEKIDEVMIQGFQSQRTQRLLKTWEHLILLTPDSNIASREGV
jgi:hypothetical protein